jgi:hypothetical protein
LPSQQDQSQTEREGAWRGLGDTGAGERGTLVGIEEKMARWGLAAIAVLAAAALFFAAEAQQGHQTERISGKGLVFFYFFDGHSLSLSATRTPLISVRLFCVLHLGSS